MTYWVLYCALFQCSLKRSLGLLMLQTEHCKTDALQLDWKLRLGLTLPYQYHRQMKKIWKTSTTKIMADHFLYSCCNHTPLTHKNYSSWEPNVIGWSQIFQLNKKKIISDVSPCLQWFLVLMGIDHFDWKRTKLVSWISMNEYGI